MATKSVFNEMRLSFLIGTSGFRRIFYQVLVSVCFFVFCFWVWGNVVDNFHRSNLVSGFSFLDGRAGFDINQSLIPYDVDSTYRRALLVGFLNTLLVAVCGILLSSFIGLFIGIGRLSHNWLIRSFSTLYIEIFRNIPPLLVIFFWYLGVLAILPLPRNSLSFFDILFLNNRGFFLPKPIWEGGFSYVFTAFVIGLFFSVFVWRWITGYHLKTGKELPRFLISIALIASFVFFGRLFGGEAVVFEYPLIGTFNLKGGLIVSPEFLSLTFALSFYTAAFIAEIVRGGILGMGHGQLEAALSIGLSRFHVLRFVIMPQALRLIIPPLTSQYLNIAKNSSLAIAIGYPDLVSVGGTIFNQSGQILEIVFIWMLAYLSISLITSVFMNWFNTRMKLIDS
ncbi:MAG: amino acid ABC transporter permease [Alphaproteobacteria bacterium]|nr:amino acid ABC transporter permease [Alphaproteobacteria bacterium]